jgi:hypothetical protein
VLRSLELIAIQSVKVLGAVLSPALLNTFLEFLKLPLQEQDSFLYKQVADQWQRKICFQINFNVIV